MKRNLFGLLLGALLGLVMGEALTTALTAQQLPTDKLTWDQAGSSLATVQGLTYKVYVDGAATGVALSGVACTAPVAPATLFTCAAQLPAAFTTGTHAVELTASMTLSDGRVVESAKSSSLSVAFVTAPTAPSNLRMVGGGGTTPVPPPASNIAVAVSTPSTTLTGIVSISAITSGAVARTEFEVYDTTQLICVCTGKRGATASDWYVELDTPKVANGIYDVAVVAFDANSALVRSPRRSFTFSN